MEAPILGQPAGSAFVYGLMLAPMTLPCTGPLVMSAFAIGGVGGGGALAESLASFMAFALGFGWPLVVIPLLAAPIQRRAVRQMARHHRGIEIASGCVLIAIAAIGTWTEVWAAA